MDKTHPMNKTEALYALRKYTEDGMANKATAPVALQALVVLLLPILEQQQPPRPSSGPTVVSVVPGIGEDVVTWSDGIVTTRHHPTQVA